MDDRGRGVAARVQVVRRYSRQVHLTERLRRIDLGGGTPVPVRPVPAGRVRISDRISDEQRAEIVGAYLGGATAVALADQFGISDYSVRGILIDAGVKRPSKRLSGETLAEIGSLRASGVALAEIGRRVGVSESTVSLVREASRQPASLRRDKGPADLRK